jgi:hypothetical protein
MMNFTQLTLLVGLCLILGACATSSTTRAVDDRPGLAFKNAPKDGILFIDKIQVGNPVVYDGKHQVLRLETGTHEVLVQTPSGTLLNENIFFGGGEIRTIVLTGAGEK